MKIQIIATGKLKERFWKEACGEYQKRLTKYAPVEVIENDDVDPARCGGEAQARAQEAAAIEKAIPKDSYIVCLDSRGEQMTSEQFASFIDDRGIAGCKNLVFIIGGPTGIDDDLKRKSNKLISFGKMTLPHNLAMVVALEQIYRAYRINRGEPYHK